MNPDMMGPVTFNDGPASLCAVSGSGLSDLFVLCSIVLVGLVIARRRR